MKKAFTLIELIIYLAIVSVILLVAVNFGWEIVFGNAKSQAIREVQQNSRFVMEKISRTIKTAQGVNTPLPGSSSETLSLEMAEADLNPTVFSLSGSKAWITQGTGSAFELTSERVAVSQLQFSNLSYENTPGTIRTELTIDHLNPAGRGEYQASFSLGSTVSLAWGGALVTGGCQGTALACSSFGEEDSCNSQEGCSWYPAFCSGDSSCWGYSSANCQACPGCFWFFFFCVPWFGDCAYLGEAQCSICPDCSVTPASCSGTATACQNFDGEAACQAQAGCQWVLQ